MAAAKRRKLIVIKDLDENNSKGKVNLESICKDQQETKKNKKQNPKFRLRTSYGESASLACAKEDRIPLTLTDIQHLLLHSLFGNLNLCQPPRWYVLDKCASISHTSCLVLEGCSIEHWLKYKQYTSASDGMDVVEIVTPSAYGGSLTEELALVPLSECEKNTLIEKYGSVELAMQVREDLMIMMKAMFPINEVSECSASLYQEDTFPRTQLLLSASQLIFENYPLPLKGKLKHVYADYVMTKDEYAPVCDKSPMFGLDCEMCMTSAGSELTRVSVVNEKYEIIYESFVKPYNNITDYLTRFSGITKSKLENVTKRLQDVQKELKEVLPPDAILVGQSLNIDLHALKMMHPYIIDTSVIYNFVGERGRKPKLKALASKFLNEEIQIGQTGHCSVEDSITSLKLVQLKLKNSLEFGDAVHTNRMKYKENLVRKQKTEEVALPIFNHMIEQKKTSLVIGCDDITGDYHTYLTKAKQSINSQLKRVNPKKVKLNTVDTHEDAIQALSDASNSFNFAMTHLKLDINSDNESNVMSKVKQWMSSVWDSLIPASLFVVLFPGKVEENGIAIIKVKPAT